MLSSILFNTITFLGTFLVLFSPLAGDPNLSLFFHKINTLKEADVSKACASYSNCDCWHDPAKYFPPWSISQFFILSNLDWPGLTLPPDIGGAYSTHICHANLTQGSLTYTSCESSGFRHLYEILHRCDVRSLYGRSWQTKTKGFFKQKILWVSFLLFLCSFVFSPCLFLSHFATTPSKPGISRSSGQTVQMYRPRSSFPGRSFLKPIDFF